MREFVRSLAVPRPLLALFALGALLRVGFALWLGGDIYQPDEGVYVTLAKNIAQRGVFGYGAQPHAGHPPALAAFLAAFYALGGGSVLAARLAFALLAAALPPMLYGYARRHFGPRTAAFAGGAAALYPIFVYWSGIMMTESVIAVALLGGVWATQELVAAPRPTAAYLGTGLVWGLAALTRSQVIPLPWLLAPLILRAHGWRRALRPVALLLCVASALPAAWSVRNWKHFGVFAQDTHAGYTLIIRVMFYEADHEDTGLAQRSLERTELYRRAMELGEIERDRFFAAAAFRFIKENPATYARHCLGNFLEFWRFYPRTDKTVGVVPSAHLGKKRELFVALALLTEPLLILGGLAGLVLGLRAGRPVAVPALAVAFTAAVHTLVIAQMRYRVGVMAFVILFAAVAAEEVYRRCAPASGRGGEGA